MGLIGLLMAYSGGLWGILSGLTKSTDHPSVGYRIQGMLVYSPMGKSSCELSKLWSPFGSPKY